MTAIIEYIVRISGLDHSYREMSRIIGVSQGAI